MAARAARLSLRAAMAAASLLLLSPAASGQSLGGQSLFGAAPAAGSGPAVDTTARQAAANALTAANNEASRAEAAETALGAHTIAGAALTSNPTAAQIAAALPVASTSGPSLMPALTGSTTTFLRSDGTQAAPPSGGTSFTPGTALTLNSGTLSVQIGTTNGTVAGGSDSRITGALQASAAGPLATAPGSSAANAISTALGFTPAPTASPQFSGTPTSVTPGAGDNSTRISTTAFDTALVATETSRAETAEAALLPKSGTTVAGLNVSASPTAAQLAAALPAASTSGPGLVPTLTGSTTTFLRSDGTQATPPSASVVTTSAPGLVPTLPGTSTTALTGAGIFAPVAVADGAASLSAQTAGPSGAVVFRTFKSLLGDAFVPRNYGAAGNDTSTPISSAYPSITSLAALVSYANGDGETPFASLDNPLFGLTSTISTTAAAAAGATSLNFAEPSHSNVGDGGAWTVSYLAPWQDPDYALVAGGSATASPKRANPGDVISGACGANVIAGVAYTSVIQGELLPGSTNWAAGASYSTQTVTASFFGTVMYLQASPGFNPVNMTLLSTAGLPYRAGVVSGSGQTYTIGAPVPATGAIGAIVYLGNNTTINVASAPTSGAFAAGQTLYLPGYGVVTISSVSGSVLTVPAMTISSGTFTASSTTPQTVTMANEVFANGGFYQATNGTVGAAGSVTTNAVAGAQATFGWNGSAEIMTVTTAPTSGAFAVGNLIYGPAVPTGMAITSITNGTTFVLNTPADQQFTASSPSMVNANTAGPAGTGAAIADGGVTWKFLKPVASQNVPSGVVYLTTALSAACASGSAITMTIAPAQLAARTIDWLGVQTAIKDAYFNASGAGGKVDLGAGQFVLNGPLFNPGGSSNTANFVPNVSIFGHGEAVTQLVWNTDLNQDQCGLGESVQQFGFVSGNVYRDFSIQGPGAYTNTEGVAPNKMDGLCVGTSAEIYQVKSTNMNAGIRLIGNHQKVFNSTGGGGYGILLAAYSPNVGNQDVYGGSFAGSIAGIGVANTNQLDSAQVSHLEVGYGYLGIYQIPGTPNVTYTPAVLVHATIFDGVSNESLGGPFILGTSSQATVANNIFIGLSAETTVSSSLELPDGNGGVIPDAAFFQVYNLTNNSFVSTAMNNIAQFSTAVLWAANTCSDNQFHNDVNIIQGISGLGAPTVASPSLKCANGGNNTDETSIGRFEWFFVASSAAGQDFTSAFSVSGVPVSLINNIPQMGPINGDGGTTYGVTANPCAESNLCPVQVSGTANVQTIGSVANLTPVVATHMGQGGGYAGGIVQALDASGGILGTALNACSGTPAAPASCPVLLGARGGAPNVQTGQTAGANSSTPFQMTTREVEFTGSGTYAALPVVGVPGDLVTVYNDGTAAITVSITTTTAFGAGSFLPSGSTVTCAAAAVCKYKRTGAAQWHVS